MVATALEEHSTALQEHAAKSDEHEERLAAALAGTFPHPDSVPAGTSAGGLDSVQLEEIKQHVLLLTTDLEDAQQDAQASTDEAEKLMNEVVKARAELEAEKKAHEAERKAHGETVEKHKDEVSVATSSGQPRGIVSSLTPR